MAQPDLMGLMLVASQVLAGVYVEESEVFAEYMTENDWAAYDTVS